MTRTRRTIFACALALMGAVTLLGGCGNPTGYSEEAPPAGGPQQNSNMPPGERAKQGASPTGAGQPSAPSH